MSTVKCTERWSKQWSDVQHALRHGNQVAVPFLFAKFFGHVAAREVLLCQGGIIFFVALFSNTVVFIVAHFVLKCFCQCANGGFLSVVFCVGNILFARNFPPATASFIAHPKQGGLCLFSPIYALFEQVATATVTTIFARLPTISSQFLHLPCGTIFP